MTKYNKLPEKKNLFIYKQIFSTINLATVINDNTIDKKKKKLNWIDDIVDKEKKITNLLNYQNELLFNLISIKSN